MYAGISSSRTRGRAGTVRVGAHHVRGVRERGEIARFGDHLVGERARRQLVDQAAALRNLRRDVRAMPAIGRQRIVRLVGEVITGYLGIPGEGG